MSLVTKDTLSNNEGVLLPIAIDVWAYSSIAKSFVLSPMAYVFSRGIFKCSDMYFMPEAFEYPSGITS